MSFYQLFLMWWNWAEILKKKKEKKNCQLSFSTTRDPAGERIYPHKEDEEEKKLGEPSVCGRESVCVYVFTQLLIFLSSRRRFLPSSPAKVNRSWSISSFFDERLVKLPSGTRMNHAPTVLTIVLKHEYIEETCHITVI